jgi:hypothetical protein
MNKTTAKKIYDENTENQSHKKQSVKGHENKDNTLEIATCGTAPLSETKKIKWTEHKRKHFPPKNIAWKRIVASTKSGPAKYLPTIDIEKIERNVWAHGKTYANRSWKIMAFKEIIGASKGEETPYVKVECGIGTIHGHPITAREYEKLLESCN